MLYNMARLASLSFYFFFNDTATTEIYTLSLHDALPICRGLAECGQLHQLSGPLSAASHRRGAPDGLQSVSWPRLWGHSRPRSEEHTSELQSRPHLVCRLLLEKKKELEIDIRSTFDFNWH